MIFQILKGIKLILSMKLNFKKIFLFLGIIVLFSSFEDKNKFSKKIIIKNLKGL
jgi:hypothetical protein